MYVVSAGKHLARQVPGGRASLWHKPDHFRLTLAYRAQVTIEKLFVIRDGLAVPAMHERRGERAQPCETDHVFCERGKTSARVNGVGREDGIRRNALEDAIACEDCAVGLAQKRA